MSSHCCGNKVISEGENKEIDAEGECILCQNEPPISQSYFPRTCPVVRENPAIRISVEKSNAAYHRLLKESDYVVDQVTKSVDQDVRSITDKLRERAKLIDKWAGDIRTLISSLREEIHLQGELRIRVDNAMTVLQIAEAINVECKTRRLAIMAMGPGLVPDEVDTAFGREERLLKDIRELLNNMRSEIDGHQNSNIVCKTQLEYDWSDKTEGYLLETKNIGLRTKGPIEFHPGATRLQDNQSTPDHWLQYTMELVRQGNAVFEQSKALRARVEENLAKNASDMRDAANKVITSLENSIANAECNLKLATDELNRVLQQITKAETINAKLAHTLRECDLNLKVSQSRQANRNVRPRAENTRDDITMDLICESQHLNSHGVCLKKQMEQADTTTAQLYHARSLLEEKVALLLRVIYVERDRLLAIRSKFPDSTELSGF